MRSAWTSSEMAEAPDLACDQCGRLSTTWKVMLRQRVRARVGAHNVVGELRRHGALQRPVPGPGKQIALAAVSGDCRLQDIVTYGQRFVSG